MMNISTQRNKKLILLFTAVFFGVSGYSQNDASGWESIDSRPTPGWFENAKLGIFIHWGVYSVPAWAPVNEDIGVYAKYAEWYWWRKSEDSEAGKMFKDYHINRYGEDFYYQDFAPAFKAQHWDPGQWAKLFKNAGAQYVVLTSKHHEGFCLWPSAHSWNWNSMDVGPHRDLCGDLSTAVKEAGLRMGFYYSLYEWYNPLYKNNLEEYVDHHMIPQMKDLVTRYEPDILWTDGEWDHPSEAWKSTDFLSWLFSESTVKDRICINDRWGSETRGKHGGYFTTEYGIVYGDEKDINKVKHPWEECRGIGTSFGYNQMEGPGNYMSSKELVNLLIEKVAAGGNLLLDVGPTADGRIPAIQQLRLQDLGNWLKIHGEAIYDSRKWDGSVHGETSGVYFTRKGDDLYVLCTKFPEKALEISGINRPESSSLLGYKGRIKTSSSGSRVTIMIPQLTPADNPSEFAWVFKLEGALRLK